MQTRRQARKTEPASPSPVQQPTTPQLPAIRKQSRANNNSKRQRVEPSRPLSEHSTSTHIPSRTLESIHDLHAAIAHLRTNDPKLAGVITQCTEMPTRLLSRPSEETCFQALVKSIIFQQLSMKAAGTIYSRFLHVAGVSSAPSPSPSPNQQQRHQQQQQQQQQEAPSTPAPGSRGRGRKRQAEDAVEGTQSQGDAGASPQAPVTPPTAPPAAQLSTRQLLPSDVLSCSTEQLRSVGLSGQKATYIQGIAAAFAQASEDAQRGCPATLHEDILRTLPEEELVQALVELKGVGQWTADMISMFHLGKPNILPVGDLGVRKGMQQLYKLPSLPTPAKMMEIAEKWHPYKSVGSWYMWRLVPGGGIW